MTPINPETDKVVLSASLCCKGENGHMHCPDVLFQVDSEVADSLQGGQYGVILCDTRNKQGVPTGKYVNSYLMLTDKPKVSTTKSYGALRSSDISNSVKPRTSRDYVESKVESPIISSIDIHDGMVEVSCSSLSPICTWSLSNSSESPT